MSAHLFNLSKSVSEKLGNGKKKFNKIKINSKK